MFLIEDSEERSVPIEAGAAEHRLGLDAVEVAQLIEHERAKAAFRKNAGTSGAFGHVRLPCATHDTRE